MFSTSKTLRFLLISGLLVALFSSCLNRSKSTTTPSDDPTVKSMYFLSNDSFPGLAKATFYVEEGLDTGRIYNADSILYGTRLDSVGLRITYNHTPAAALIYTPQDTISLTGSDVIDFTQKPMLLQVVAENMQARKWYRIEVSAHQVDPDLFVWERMATDVFAKEYAEQQAVWFKNALFLYLNNGLQTKVLTSRNGAQWSELTLTGIGTIQAVKEIVALEDTLFYAQDKTLYRSTDGAAWEAMDVETDAWTELHTMFAFNDSLWLRVKDDSDELRFALLNGNTLEENDILPQNFPVSDYAFIPFITSNLRQRAMLIGGYDREGNMLNTRWNVEYTPTNGYQWVNFTSQKSKFDAIAGCGAVSYNDNLYLFGGANEDNEILKKDMLVSKDEGINWSVPDSMHNFLPDEYASRARHTVLLDSDNYIYIIGGQNRTGVLTDVYRGKLNNIDWDD